MKLLYVLLVFIMFLSSGCGYKADPVYVDKNSEKVG